MHMKPALVPASFAEMTILPPLDHFCIFVKNHLATCGSVSEHSVLFH